MIRIELTLERRIGDISTVQRVSASSDGPADGEWNSELIASVLRMAWEKMGPPQEESEARIRRAIEDQKQNASRAADILGDAHATPSS